MAERPCCALVKLHHYKCDIIEKYIKHLRCDILERWKIRPKIGINATYVEFLCGLWLKLFIIPFPIQYSPVHLEVVDLLYLG